MENLLIKFRELEWTSPMPGLRKKEIVIGNKKLRLVEFSDNFVEPDWCCKGHIGYIIEGRLTLDFDGRIVQYEKGDGVFIPESSAAKHKCHVNKGEKALVFLVENV
jgi:quercetin dioxygenase-like cupin family protein